MRRLTSLLLLVLSSGCSSEGGGGGAQTPDAGDDAPLGVIDTFPANGSTGLAGNLDLLIEFGSPMDSTTVRADPFSSSMYWEGDRLLVLPRGLLPDLRGDTRYTAPLQRADGPR